MALSVMAHGVAALAILLFVPSSGRLTDLPAERSIAMLFEPARTVQPLPALPLSALSFSGPLSPPSVPPPSIPDSPEPISVNIPLPESTPPAAQQAPVVQAPAVPPSIVAPPPAPAPIAVTHLVPKVPAPVVPTRPPVRQEAGTPHSPAAAPRARSAQDAAPAGPPPVSVAAADPTATAPLVPPRPVAGMETNRAPVYPEIALRRREQGDVLLSVNVSAHGRPLAVDVMQTSGHLTLDHAALAAVREWDFIPATQGGRPVRAVAEVPVRFRLSE